MLPAGNECGARGTYDAHPLQEQQLPPTRPILAALFAAAALAGAGTFAACGDDGHPVGREVFRSQANTTCEKFQGRLTALQQRASAATPATRPTLLRDTAALLRSLSDALAKVKPSDDQRRGFEDLIGSFRRVSSLYSKAAQGFESGAADAEATLAEGVKEAQRPKQLANELDLPACGGGKGARQ
jgi:hypothetical protein